MNQKMEYLFTEMKPIEIESSLQDKLEQMLYQKYGGTPDEQITLRLREEWLAMEQSGTALDVAALYELAIWLKENDHPYWIRGCAGSSFILYLLGITSGNPLPPHYRCPVCGAVQWMPGYRDGFDLPKEKYCAKENAKMEPDGHDIPWQTLWGYGDHEPVFDLDVPNDLKTVVSAFLDNHWLKQVKPDYEMHEVHSHENSAALGQIRVNFRLDKVTIHPSFHQKKVDAACVSIALEAWQTLLDYYDGYDENSIIGVDTFADLLAFYGLHHGMGTWDEETVYLNRELDYAPSELIAFRDDVFQYLISHGFLPKDAWMGMNRVRKGAGLPVITEEMKHTYDKWVLRRCEKIGYLFPKSHAVEHILFRMKAVILPDTIQLMRTGFNSIDYALGGINQSDVIVAGGRPGMGKTSFALDIAFYLACTAGKNVTIFTRADNLEDIDFGMERRGCKDRAENIAICSEEALSISVLRNRLASGPTDFVIVDDLQHFVKSGKKTQIASIMQQIREIAREYCVPILLLTNLSRRIEHRKSHIPLLRDIPSFESVIPFADSVLLLYREAYYDMEANRDEAWCFIEKNVRGGLGAVPLKWSDHKNGFENSTT